MKSSALFHTLAEVALRWENKEYRQISSEEAEGKGLRPVKDMIYLDQFSPGSDVKDAVAFIDAPDSVSIRLNNGFIVKMNVATCEVYGVDGLIKLLTLPDLG